MIEQEYDFREAEIPGGLVIEDTESADAVIEIGRNYTGNDYEKHYDPVFLGMRDVQDQNVILALDVEAATELRDALNGLITLYS